MGVWWRFGRWQWQRWVRGLRLDWFPGRKLRGAATRESLQADARAGVNVGLLAFPQSIAYSLIADLPPQFGLMSSGLGAAVGSLGSGSRFIVSGPTNATAILLFAGLTAAGIPEDKRVAALPLFVLLVGLCQLLGALFKVSALLNYVSRSVITGYLTAAAVMIMVNQV